MRFFFILYIFFLINSGKAQEIEKCEERYNSFKTAECLKKLKSKLTNYELSFKIYTTNKNLYKNKNVYISICNKILTSHKYSAIDGSITIKLKPKYLKNCESLISIDIISEYGQCTAGKYAIANWNSLNMDNFVYFSCSNLK